MPFCIAAVITASACLRWRVHAISPPASQPLPKRTSLRDVDIFGSILLSCTVIPILLMANAVSHLMRTSSSWNYSLLAIICFVLAISSGYALYHVEMHASKPIVDFGMLRDRAVSYTCTLNFAAAFAHHSVLYSLPFYVIIVDHRSATQAGFYLLPVAFSASLGSLLVGLLVARHGRYRAFLLFGSCLAAGGPLFLASMASTGPSKMHDLFKYLSILPASAGAQIISSVSIVSILAVRGDKDLAACTGLLSREPCIVLYNYSP